jgi:hypothetical protein
VRLDLFLETARGLKGWLSEGKAMLDLVFVVATVLFFALSILYVHSCERLK